MFIHSSIGYLDASERARAVLLFELAVGGLLKLSRCSESYGLPLSAKVCRRTLTCGRERSY